MTRRRVNSVRYGTASVFFLAPKIWDILSKEIKNSETLHAFKLKSKSGFLRNALVDFAKHMYRK